MAQVIVTFRVMPKSVEVNLDELENKIKFLVNPERIEREPIAFGLTALNIIKIVPDAGGEVDTIENKLKSIDEIGEVEVVGVSRML